MIPASALQVQRADQSAGGRRPYKGTLADTADKRRRILSAAAAVLTLQSNTRRDNGLPGPHVVRCGADGRRALTLGQYVELWRRVKAAPAGAQYRETLTSWAGGSREQILAEFARGADDRINRRVQGYGAGRKWSRDYFYQCRRLADDLRARRRPRLADVPLEFRARLADKIGGYDD